jgi:hypothetical protein
VAKLFSGCPPPTSGVVAVAAGWGHALALMTNGTVVAWGLYDNQGTQVPPNMTGVKAIACGFDFSVALLTNGTVTGWGAENPTNVASSLSNVTAIAAGTLYTLALQTNGTVVAWGNNGSGESLLPPGLTNVVAIAAGGEHSLALTSSGNVVAWGDNTFGQCDIPSGVNSNVMAIAAGDEHCLALLNDGTLVAWGDNSAGQTNLPSGSTNFPVKLIAAGGFHSMAALWSPLVQYPVDVSKDLLLIYNTNSLDSSNVCQYYLTHRPMVSNANVLAITNCTTDEVISPSDFTNIFMAQVQGWLATNRTLRPQYVILFQDVPSRSSYYTGGGQTNEQPSVQYQLNQWCATNWHPFVTAVNMNGTGGTNDCIAYINKLTNMAGTNQTLFISASAGRYGNTNWYFDGPEYPYGGEALSAAAGVTNADPAASVFISDSPAYPSTFITNATNVVGYYSVGWDGGAYNELCP